MQFVQSPIIFLASRPRERRPRAGERERERARRPPTLCVITVFLSSIILMISDTVTVTLYFLRAQTREASAASSAGCGPRTASSRSSTWAAPKTRPSKAAVLTPLASSPVRRLGVRMPSSCRREPSPACSAPPLARTASTSPSGESTCHIRKVQGQKSPNRLVSRYLWPRHT